MTEFDKFAQDNGFQLKLGRSDFVYTETQKKLTLPVEMQMQGEYLWELSRESVGAWDPPFEAEKIDPTTAYRILQRIERFVELTGKKVRVIN
jgi:hypothetical protein